MSGKVLIAIIAGACALLLAVPLMLVGAVGGVVAAVSANQANGATCTPQQGLVAAPDGGSGMFSATNANGTTIALNATQLGYAATIAQVGKQMGVSAAGIQTAFVTVLQESGFRLYANSSVPESLKYPHDAVGSDHDSVNLFQQRANWGSVADRMNVEYSAAAFFGGPAGPNHGSPGGLLDKVPAAAASASGSAQPSGLITPPIGQWAQTVQVSAFPDAYAKWTPVAQALAGRVGSGYGCSINPAGQFPIPAGKNGQAVVSFAELFVGVVPYSLSGCGDAANPAIGFCCTGLVYYAYKNVMGIDLPEHVVSGQVTHMHEIPASEAQAGDLVVWPNQHIAIYDGHGGIVHAPDVGRMVEHNPSHNFSIGGEMPQFMRVNGLPDGW